MTEINFIEIFKLLNQVIDGPLVSDFKVIVLLTIDCLSQNVITELFKSLFASKRVDERREPVTFQALQ